MGRDTPNGTFQISVVPTGVGQPKPVVTRGFDAGWQEWMPDGKRLLMSAKSATGQSLYYVQAPDGSDARAIPAPAMSSTQCYSVSPDGSTIADVTADAKMALVPVVGGPARIVAVDPPARCTLTWDPTGKFVYYTDAAQLPARIQKLEIASGKTVLFRSIEPPDRAGVQTVSPIRMTPDGKTIAFSYRRSLSELLLVDGLK
jgi:Tol biopolymer transport system component